MTPSLWTVFLYASLIGPCTGGVPTTLTMTQLPSTALPSINLTWTGGGPFTAALVTLTTAPYLVQDDFTQPQYSLGSSWTTPGYKGGVVGGNGLPLGMTVEEMSPPTPAYTFTFSPASYLTIANSDTATSTDFWSGYRWPINTALAAPLFYDDVPLRGSWQAEIRMAAPVSSVAGSMQCGLALFDRQNIAAPPFSAANPNANSQYLVLVAANNGVACCNSNLVFENPGLYGNSVYSAFTAPGITSPYLSLMLQFDHVAGVYSAFWRPTATSPYTFLASKTTAAQIINTIPNPRLGVMAKSWVTGRTWSCGIDYVSVQALPNVPYTQPWVVGVAQNVSASSALGGAQGLALLANDTALTINPNAAGGGSIVLPLDLPGLFVGASVTLVEGTNSSSSTTTVATKPTPLTPVLYLLPYPSAINTTQGSCVNSPPLSPGDTRVLRFHHDYTSLPPSPLLFINYPALSGSLAPALVDCSQ